MSQLAQDTFIRADQSGFGAASDGKTWARDAGVGVSNIVSNQGKIGPGGNDSQFVLGSGTAGTINILCRVKSGDAGNVAAVLFRYSSTGGASPNGYRAGIFGGNLVVDKYVSGTRTNIGSTSVSYVVGEEWWIRAVASSTSIKATAWKDGTSEPGTPQLNLTDSSNSTGKYGVSVFMNADFTYFDSLTVTDNQSATQATKDISSRFRLLAQSTKDIASRFRLSAQRTKDLSARLRLFAISTRDTTTRLRLLATSTRDISSRIRLSAQSTRDLAARLRLQAAGTLKDIQARVRLSALQTRDMATRLRLLATLSRDLSLRVRLSASRTRDVQGRVRLLALLMRDVTARLRLQASAGGVTQDISMRLRLIVSAHATITLTSPRGALSLLATRGTITLTSPRGTIVLYATRGTATLEATRGDITLEGI
jgi:hypothetical protein